MENLINRLFAFTAKDEHVKKELLKATSVEQFLKVIADKKYAVTWYVQQEVIKHFSKSVEQETPKADKKG